MTSFLLTTITTAPQTLANGEVGQIAPNGGIATGAINPVTMTATSTLQNLGTIMSMEHINVYDGNRITISNGSTGQINASGIYGAIYGFLSAPGFSPVFDLNNAGLIQGNKGRCVAIVSSSTYATATAKIENSGVLQSSSQAILLDLQGVDSKTYITNSGTILGSHSTTILLGAAGEAWITNSGVILNDMTGGAALNAYCELTLRNTGTILGGVSTGANSLIRNSGTITGDLKMSGTLRNSGLVDGDVTLGSGGDLVDTRGGRVTGTISVGLGNDTVVADDSSLVLADSGGSDLVEASVSFALVFGFEGLRLTGAENLWGTGTFANNFLIGNAGNNRLLGLGGDDELQGGEGDNLLRGNAGNDTLSALGGNDTILGGAGDDTVYWLGGNDSLAGGLGVDTLVLWGVLAGGVTVSLSAATAPLANGDTLRISGFENLVGSAFDDSLTGNGLANEIIGGDGNDTIVGLGGDDLLLGGGGNDSLSGGAGNDTFSDSNGQDTLSGGSGADLYVMEGLDMSPAAAPDRITDFGPGDRIDLSVIDAVAGGADDAFVFVGTLGFAGTGPQLRFVQDVGANTTTVQARLGGSVSPDLVIVLDGLVGLTADSFLL